VVAGAARRWYTSAVPHRRQARPLRGPQARPLHDPSSAARFLPPQPLSEGGRSGVLRRVGRRSLAIGGVVLVALVLIPFAVAALGPTVGSLEPLAGEVRGAISDPTPQPTGPYLAAIDLNLGFRRSIDGDGPFRAPRVAPPPSSLTGYVWPIRNGRITLPFKAIPGGEWINDGKLFHDGVDMASFCGAPVGSAHSGVVLAAGRHFDAEIGWVGDLQPYFHVLDTRQMWGDLPIVVVIDDGNGYRSIYAHFRDATVRPGQFVSAGQLIGHEGATGHASGCHVHYGLFSPFETKTFGVRADILRHLKVPNHEIARIDPLLVLPGGEVALRTRSIAMTIVAARSSTAPPAASTARPSVAVQMPWR